MSRNGSRRANSGSGGGLPFGEAHGSAIETGQFEPGPAVHNKLILPAQRNDTDFAGTG